MAEIRMPENRNRQAGEINIILKKFFPQAPGDADATVVGTRYELQGMSSECSCNVCT